MSWIDKDAITKKQKQIFKINKLFRKEQIIEGYKKDCQMFNENKGFPKCDGLTELNCINCRFYKVKEEK